VGVRTDGRAWYDSGMTAETAEQKLSRYEYVINLSAPAGRRGRPSNADVAARLTPKPVAQAKARLAELLADP
jgi:hypothetical protein